MNAGQKIFNRTAPAKGSFPLDHEGECKSFMQSYMNCMKQNAFDNSKCRLQSKDYLQCRMERELMAPETMSRLGLPLDDCPESSKTSEG